jgi:hypothetical protein
MLYFNVIPTKEETNIRLQNNAIKYKIGVFLSKVNFLIKKNYIQLSASG